MSQLNYKLQDNLLLNDILKRNYYDKFIQGQGSINLSFFSNNTINNTRFIPNYIDNKITFNLEKILNQLEIFLKWCQEQSFCCPFIINDKILITEYLTILSDILSIFNKTNIKQKIIINLYKSDLINIEFLSNLINQYSNIEFIMNIDLIDINKVQNLSNIVKYKVFIDPSSFNSLNQLIDNYNLITTNNCQIFNFNEITSELWSTEKIAIYLQFISYLLKDKTLQDLLISTNSLINIKDLHIIDNNNCKADCCFQQSLNVFINNLSINLCHMFQYDDQLIGQFVIKNNRIVNIESKIIELIVLNTHLKRSSTPHCENCNIIGLCHGFCYALAYQKSLNPIIPIKEYCNLQKSKYIFIFKSLIQNDLINENIISNCLNHNYISLIYANYLNSLYQILKEDNYG